ncbi:MAG TPA: D-glycero-beta-D-manno-heptose 1-phosphate adenylyltransferase, partial [Gemmataceae bacterium]|nr:D-glycero-beta-D-manno-heptose 1-phosphate adenylyltransferase [Gemmataceae bacterium]
KRPRMLEFPVSADLIQLVQDLGQPRVLVLGDLMLDRYIWGDAERISQEAPVALLRADRREERLGGASSVATMLRALGANVSIAGVVGEDADAKRIREMLTDLEIDPAGVVADASRPTTLKERYIGRAQQRHPQQMMRVDYESRLPVSEPIARELLRHISRQLSDADLVLISDYDKGVCVPGLLRNVIAAASHKGIRTLADPIRGRDYRKYHGCSALTPNRLETSLASGRTIEKVTEALAAAGELRELLDLEAMIVTLDKDGMALAHADGRRQHFATRPRQVYDITGAGDMVLSVLGLALAAGADYDPAIRLGNVAGGLEVEKIGVATITRDEILRELLRGSGSTKLYDLTSLRLEIEHRRSLGQKIAFTNGCFDVLHAGHVQYLQEARAQGDALIVAVNSDESVRSLKGPQRPINSLEARVMVLAGMQAVDYLTVFDDLTPMRLIEELRPDVLVKGGDYRPGEVVGSEFVKSYGGRVHLASLREGFSTTRLLKRMKAA